MLLWPDNVFQKVTGSRSEISVGGAALFFERGPLRQPRRPFCGVRRTRFVAGNPWPAADGLGRRRSHGQIRRAKNSAALIKSAYRVFTTNELKGFPEPLPASSAPGKKKVIVTGSYDWFHSGHVRFLEEVSGYGDLYVVVGHDANIRLLKGEGHPLLPQAERRYVVGSIKYVKQALISSGERLAGRRPGNPQFEAGHLCRERRRRQGRQARVLPETGHRVSRPQTHSSARSAPTHQHGAARILMRGPVIC